MSGGAFDYSFYRVAEASNDFEKFDIEISELLSDLADLYHDLEWWQSGDYSEKQFNDALAEFKNKWFNSNREVRLRGYVDEAVEKLRIDLYNLIGVKSAGR